jgi:hypothetical protein
LRAITGRLLKSVTTILDKYLARTRALAGEAVSLFENANEHRVCQPFANRNTELNKGSVQVIEKIGAPEEIRTPDPQIRSLVLYPAELRVRLPCGIAGGA